jgi:hypothetical protein
MLQSTLLEVADIVNYRLGTPREHKSTTIATLLLGSYAAVDGENCACNLFGITASSFRLGTHFGKPIAIELRGVERYARLGGNRIPAVAEPTRTSACISDFTTNPNRRMRELLRSWGEEHLIECCVIPWRLTSDLWNPGIGA